MNPFCSGSALQINDNQRPSGRPAPLPCCPAGRLICHQRQNSCWLPVEMASGVKTGRVSRDHREQKPWTARTYRSPCCLFSGWNNPGVRFCPAAFSAAHVGITGCWGSRIITQVFGSAFVLIHDQHLRLWLSRKEFQELSGQLIEYPGTVTLAGPKAQ